MTREDVSLYVMGQYDGDVTALERAIAEDPELAAVAAEEARLELLLRDAGAAATFCAGCTELVRGERCDACGAALRPGGYAIERVLVANAHGRMYAARDADGTRVALKELAFVHAPSAEALVAFEREAKLLRALEHPAIPRFLASFEEGQGVHLRYYLAQELVAGTPLDRLDDHWYGEAEVVAIGKQVLAILVYLQGLSPMVIHRDVKPANLLKRADGSIALVDFGAAHVQGTTAGSTTIGTFGYMPIEQLAGEVDATTDVYALGMTMLHLLTRQEPWRIVHARAEINVSPALRAFLDKVTAPDPRARFASAKDALAALESLRERPAVVRTARRFARPALFAAAGVVLAASGIGVYQLASSHEAAPTSTIAILQFRLTPPGTTAPVVVDGRRVATVTDRQEVPVAAGSHVVFVDTANGGCHEELTLEGGKTHVVACDVGLAPTSKSANATLRVEIEPPTTPAVLWIDGSRIGTVSNGQQVPTIAGDHHVVLDGPGGQCQDDITVVPGEATPVDCRFGTKPPVVNWQIEPAPSPELIVRGVAPAHVKIEFGPQGAIAPIVLDGHHLDRELARSVIPVTPGEHDIFIDAPGKPCWQQFTAKEGEILEIVCGKAAVRPVVRKTP